MLILWILCQIYQLDRIVTMKNLYVHLYYVYEYVKDCYFVLSALDYSSHYDTAPVKSVWWFMAFQNLTIFIDDHRIFAIFVMRLPFVHPAWEKPSAVLWDDNLIETFCNSKCLWTLSLEGGPGGQGHSAKVPTKLILLDICSMLDTPTLGLGNELEKHQNEGFNGPLGLDNWAQWFVLFPVNFQNKSRSNVAFSQRFLGNDFPMSESPERNRWFGPVPRYCTCFWASRVSYIPTCNNIGWYDNKHCSERDRAFRQKKGRVHQHLHFLFLINMQVDHQVSAHLL